MLVIGAAVYLVAFSTVRLVGDALFSDAIRSHAAQTQNLAAALGEKLGSDTADAFHQRLLQAASQSGGRLLVVDADGKVTYDTFGERCGTLLALGEVRSVLRGEKDADYGFHLRDGAGKTQAPSVLDALTGRDNSRVWVCCYVSPLEEDVQLTGALLLLTENFILYLAVQQVVQFLNIFIVSRMADKEFPYLKECRELPEKEERNGILKNIGAMSMHKLATVIVRNTDSLLMSSFIGLATVGLYSNYRLVLNALNNLLNKFATAFSGSVGNFAALENSDRLYRVYKEMDFLCFVQSAYLTGGLMMLFNPLIALLFGGEYCFPMTTVVIIVTEFYISRMRQTNLLFREVMGLFWNDRYKAVAESIINLVASIALVQRYGVAGIVGGTIISSLCTCVWVEPYIFLKYGVQDAWQKKLRDYFAEYLKRMLLTAALSAAGVLWVQRFPVSNFGIFILDGLLYTAVFAGVIMLFYRGSAEYAALKQRGLELLKRNKEYT